MAKELIVGRSRKGAWIEMHLLLAAQTLGKVAPVRERGLKLGEWVMAQGAIYVAPVRERGLK